MSRLCSPLGAGARYGPGRAARPRADLVAAGLVAKRKKPSPWSSVWAILSLRHEPDGSRLESVMRTQKRTVFLPQQKLMGL